MCSPNTSKRPVSSPPGVFSTLRGYMVAVVGEQGERQGGDERLVAGVHSGDPLAVDAQLDSAGLEAVGIAGDGVADAELDLALADQWWFGVPLADQVQYLLEAPSGDSDEVFVAQAQIPLRGAAPEDLGGGVPGVPEGGALRGAKTGHELLVVGVRLGLLL